jgi:hypothetical protein
MSKLVGRRLLFLQYGFVGLITVGILSNTNNLIIDNSKDHNNNNNNNKSNDEYNTNLLPLIQDCINHRQENNTSNSIHTTSSDDNTRSNIDINNNPKCWSEYYRLKQNQTIGLSYDDYERSCAYYGNRKRLSNFISKLASFSSNNNDASTRRMNHTTLSSTKIGVDVVICGGSITLGHGITPKSDRYMDRIGTWMNEYYPIHPDYQNKNRTRSFQSTQDQDVQHIERHRIHSKGAHGADVSIANKFRLLRLLVLRSEFN